MVDTLLTYTWLFVESQEKGTILEYGVKLQGLIGLSSTTALQIVGSIILGKLDCIFLCSKHFPGPGECGSGVGHALRV